MKEEGRIEVQIYTSTPGISLHLQVIQGTVTYCGMELGRDLPACFWGNCKFLKAREDTPRAWQRCLSSSFGLQGGQLELLPELCEKLFRGSQGFKHLVPSRVEELRFNRF